MLSRRSFVGKVAAGAAAACAVGSAQAMTKKATAQIGGAPAEGEAPADVTAAAALTQPDNTSPPWQLLRPLALGAAVTRDWRVTGLTAVEHGSCVLTLENARGRSHRIHLCRNDGSPQGLVHTDRFDLVVMNGGAADLPTEEDLAQAVAEIAHVLAQNEAALQHGPVLAALLPHAQRVERFADAARLR